MLDPAWAALTVAIEVPVVGAGIKVLLDDGKLADRRGDATAAANAAQANLVTPAILELNRAVDSERRPKQITPDGEIPAETFEDALARGRYEDQMQRIVDAVDIRSAPMLNVRRCRRLGRILAGALAALVVAAPLALWGPLWDADGGPAAAPVVFYSALGATGALAIILGGFYISARSALSTSIADANGADT